MEQNEHLLDDILESYVFRRLPEPQLQAAEEHLLICQTCRDRLDEVRHYIMATRIAAKRMREQEVSFRAGGRERQRRWPAISLGKPAWVVAGAVLALAVFWIPKWDAHPPPVQEVVLETRRGLERVARGSTVKRLRLQLDITGLAPLPRYEVVVADAAGVTVWQGEPSRQGESQLLTVELDRTLDRGTYWVRLQELSKERRLLREYRLDID